VHALQQKRDALARFKRAVKPIPRAAHDPEWKGELDREGFRHMFALVARYSPTLRDARTAMRLLGKVRD